MRTGVLGAQRPEPHDRNPVRQTLTYSGTGIAPHATTQRFSYTVPSGKKAIVLAAQANLQRATAATTAAITRASVQLQNTLVVDARISYDNNVGARASMNIAQAGVLLPGETVIGQTRDTSTGGTVDYEIDCLITEFDA